MRANRSAHERREWARCARDRITSAVRDEAATGGGRLTSMHWCRTSCVQARRCSLRLQSRQSSGAEPTWRGCNSTLTWRGFLVLLPCHWHCSRSGQGRQLRILAPYTMRRLPSASLRCSCGISFWSSFAAQRPIGLEGKVLAGEAARFPGQAHVRGSIARGGSRVR